MLQIKNFKRILLKLRKIIGMFFQEKVEAANQRESGFTQKKSELPPDEMTERALGEYKRHDSYLRKVPSVPSAE